LAGSGGAGAKESLDWLLDLLGGEALNCRAPPLAATEEEEEEAARLEEEVVALPLALPLLELEGARAEEDSDRAGAIA
jgi:hypothetical protein